MEATKVDKYPSDGNDIKDNDEFWNYHIEFYVKYLIENRIFSECWNFIKAFLKKILIYCKNLISLEMHSENSTLLTLLT